MDQEIEKLVTELLKDLAETKVKTEKQLGHGLLDLIIEAEHGNTAIGKFHIDGHAKYKVIVTKEDD